MELAFQMELCLWISEVFEARLTYLIDTFIVSDGRVPINWFTQQDLKNHEESYKGWPEACSE